jgi:hypothetical protein
MCLRLRYDMSFTKIERMDDSFKVSMSKAMKYISVEKKEGPALPSSSKNFFKTTAKPFEAMMPICAECTI